ncbi:FmdB family transcriptional regulator [Arsenicicoccus piscis]|uniref:Putative regulatory protein FmdB zinc ribbon domain-containing protein n=1 Tax=Arsenicicoccus piscis TaxID=673954 RepID=A0ABQ6HSH5_9MICO|nr:FmdB family zinc ribbon protein [Arsenicicoccus piscis]MCH8627999.1 FmdB family transcriptional regulator [Arsenicicoccus piscis]GMA20654.1 hypothetical protein GCM10025862_26750 [Arsenicicoccus piscis]
MPTYAYKCTNCDHTFDIVQSFADDALTVCPQCDGKLRKVFNSVGVVFKGPGFYRTDSRDGAKKNGAGSGSGSNSGSGSEKGADKASGGGSASSSGGKDSTAASSSTSSSSTSTGSAAKASSTSSSSSKPAS